MIFLSGEKKSGKNTGREKESWRKILSLAKNLVTFPSFFFPDKVLYMLVNGTVEQVNK